MVDFGITIIEKIFIFYAHSRVWANSVVLLVPKFKLDDILPVRLDFEIINNFIF